MKTVRTDHTWKLKDLAQFVEPVEIYDENQKLIGLFVPAKSGRELSEGPPPIDLAELERRKRSNQKGYALKEIFEHLLSLTNDEQTRKFLLGKIDQLAERDRCLAP